MKSEEKMKITITNVTIKANLSNTRIYSSGQFAYPMWNIYFYLFAVVEVPTLFVDVVVVIVILVILPMNVIRMEFSSLRLIVKMLTRFERNINIHNDWTFDPTLHQFSIVESTFCKCVSAYCSKRDTKKKQCPNNNGEKNSEITVWRAFSFYHVVVIERG